MTRELTGRSVVLVVLDSTRADALGPNTPNIEALGREGLSFTRAVAPAAWTLPSHVSMFTGLAPSAHGAISRGRGAERSVRHARLVRELARQGMLLAPTLQRAGLSTFAASGNPWVGPLSGLDAGFGTTDYFDFLGTDPRPARPGTRSPTRLGQLSGLRRSMTRMRDWRTSGADKGASRVQDRLSAFIATQRSPFFAFVNLLETHDPHLPLPGRRPPFPRSALVTAQALSDTGVLRARKIRNHNWGVRKLSAGTLARWKEAYRAEVSYVDRWVGRMMDAISRTDHSDSTAVIVTSDHGENFGEGGIVGHGMSVREGTARVPLVIAGAGVPSRRVAAPVSLCGVSATIQHLLLDKDSHGSLLGSGAPAPALEIEDPVLFSPPPPRSRRTSQGPGAAFYDGSMKLAVDPFTGRALYDLDKDPAEERDLLNRVAPTPVQDRAFEQWQQRLTSQDL